MKIKQLLVLSLTMTLIVASCGKSAITKSKVSSEVDSLSYAIGVSVYSGLSMDSITIDPYIIAKAVLEAKDGKAFMDANSANAYINGFMYKREQDKMAAQAEINKQRFKNNIAIGDSFLQKNKENTGIIVTESGLQYKVNKMGTGPKPTETDMVKVHYTGTTINGNKFDSSLDRGEPAEFTVNGVIKGWVEALQLMPVGSKFTLYIPYDLAYGENGAGDVIEPYSVLIFDVELLEIVKQ